MFFIDYTPTKLTIAQTDETPPELARNTERFTVSDPTDLDAIGGDLMMRCLTLLGHPVGDKLPPESSDLAFGLMGEATLPLSIGSDDEETEAAPPTTEKKIRKPRKKDLPASESSTTSSEPGATAPSSEAKETTMSDKTPNTKKKAAKKKTAAKAKAKTKTAPKTKVKTTGPRGEKTLAVKKLLERKSGCTRKDILDLTGWPAVSVQTMAKAAGLKLRKEKEKGKATVYYGS